MGDYLEQKGRHLIGWDKILEGRLAKGAAVMSCRGTDGGGAATIGHYVATSPNTYYYLDHCQFPTEDFYEYPGGIKPMAIVQRRFT